MDKNNFLTVSIGGPKTAPVNFGVGSMKIKTQNSRSPIDLQIFKVITQSKIYLNCLICVNVINKLNKKAKRVCLLYQGHIQVHGHIIQSDLTSTEQLTETGQRANHGSLFIFCLCKEPKHYNYHVHVFTFFIKGVSKIFRGPVKLESTLVLLGCKF